MERIISVPMTNCTQKVSGFKGLEGYTCHCAILNGLLNALQRVVFIARSHKFIGLSATMMNIDRGTRLTSRSYTCDSKKTITTATAVNSKRTYYLGNNIELVLLFLFK